MNVVIKSPATTRQMTGISAIAVPLLAAGTITIIGVIIQEPHSLRYPNVALTVLASAAVALLTSVNASIWANYYDRDSFGATRALIDEPSLTKSESRAAWAVFNAYKFWVNLSRTAYNFGYYVLLIGIGVALLPTNDNPIRYIATSVTLLAIVIDLAMFRLAPQVAPEPTYWMVQEQNLDTRAVAIETQKGDHKVQH